jgi:hypothetical protein
MDEAVPEPDHPHRFSPFSFLGGFGIGAFVGVGLALLVFFLIKDQSTTTVVQTPTEVDAPDAVLSAAVSPTPDQRPRTKVGLDVRLGPGDGYGVIGLLNKGEAVSPIGRDADSNWLAIQFPPGSAARGWVPLDQLDNLNDANQFAVVLPTPLPRTISPFPTSPAINNGAPAVTGAGVPRTPVNVATSAAAAATAIVVTPTPAINLGPADIQIANISLLPDGRVAVTIGNRGPGDLINQSVFVLVRNLALQSEQVVAPAGTLKVGATITVQTANFRVLQAQEVVAVADPYATINDPDRSNNTLQVTLSPPRTPTPIPPPPGSGGG